MSSLPPPPPPPPWASRPARRHPPGARGPARTIRGSRSAPMPADGAATPLARAARACDQRGLRRRARSASPRRALDGGPSHPDEWDPRVADLAAFVEDERGLDFDHPVYVDFLTPAEYTAATTDGDDGAGEERASERTSSDYAGQLRALGVASGELDLYEAFNSVVDSGTLAFYDPDDERIRVRGTEMTRRPRGDARARAHPRAPGPALRPRPPATTRRSTPARRPRSARWREGDALRVEDAYIEDELTEDEQAEYDEEFAGELADSEAATERRPAVHRGALRCALRARPAVRHDAVQPGRQRRRRRRLRGAAGHRGARLRPGQLPRRRGRPTRSSSTSPTTSRWSRRVPSAPRPGTWSWPSGSTRSRPSRPPSAGTVTPSRPTSEDGDGVRAGRVRRRRADADEEEMAAALDAWARPMPGGEAEVTEVDGHPGHQGVRPRRVASTSSSPAARRRRCTCRTCGATSWPTPPSVLDPEESRCYARTVVDGPDLRGDHRPRGHRVRGRRVPADAQRRARRLLGLTVTRRPRRPTSRGPGVR